MAEGLSGEKRHVEGGDRRQNERRESGEKGRRVVGMKTGTGGR